MTGCHVMPPPCCMLLVRPGLRSRVALLLRHRVPAPLQLAGLGIVRFEVAGNVEIVAADADDHVVLDDHRRDRAVVELVRDRRSACASAPCRPSCSSADEIAVGRFEVQRVAEHADAAIADVIAALSSCHA